MRQELVYLYMQRYPGLFKDSDMLLRWGLAVGDGWFEILDALFSQIDNHINYVNSKDGEKINISILQIKEKFGGLRFYYNGGDDEIAGMVRMAEAMAGRTCQECGKPGKGRGGELHWIRVLCDEHFKEALEQQNKERA